MDFDFKKKPFGWDLDARRYRDIEDVEFQEVAADDCARSLARETRRAECMKAAAAQFSPLKDTPLVYFGMLASFAEGAEWGDENPAEKFAGNPERYDAALEASLDGYPRRNDNASAQWVLMTAETRMRPFLAGLSWADDHPAQA